MSPSQSCPLSKLDELLLATDRSAFSDGAVREAINFAVKCSSRLYVMSVLETNPQYETIGADVYEKEETEALKYLESVKARALQAGVYSWEAVFTFWEQADRLVGQVDVVEKRDKINLRRERGREGGWGIERAPGAARA